MADIKLRWSDADKRYIVVADDSGQPMMDEGVAQTAAIAAIGTWARAREGDPLPGFEGDRKGHWADPYDPRGRKGCRVWLLTGRILNDRTLEDAKAYLEEGLDGLIPDWITGHEVEVWRSGATGAAGRARLFLPDGREETVDIDLSRILGAS